MHFLRADGYKAGPKEAHMRYNLSLDQLMGAVQARDQIRSAEIRKVTALLREAVELLEDLRAERDRYKRLYEEALEFRSQGA
jgi:hypothetical protein